MCVCVCVSVDREPGRRGLCLRESEEQVREAAPLGIGGGVENGRGRMEGSVREVCS